MESLRLTTTFLATTKAIYDAWISGERHGAMTGGAATSDPQKGGAFTAWDGYISGKYLELEPGKRILQAWRTTEFPDNSPDSRLEVKFVKAPEGTRLTVLQSGIPDGQGEMYADAWQEHYFAPMSIYFEPKVSLISKKKSAARVAKKKAVPAKKKAVPAKKKAVPAKKKTTAPPKKKKSAVKTAKPKSAKLTKASLPTKKAAPPKIGKKKPPTHKARRK